MEAENLGTRFWFSESFNFLICNSISFSTVGCVLSESDLVKGIQFQGVSFRYPTRPGVPVFTSLDFSLREGAVTAVVGPSGSGKSTIATLLLRFYDPDAGSILIGGYNSREIRPDSLRNHTGIVSQVSLSILTQCRRDFLAIKIRFPCLGIRNFLSLRKAWSVSLIRGVL